MSSYELEEKGKWMIAGYTAIVFILLSLPTVYKTVGMVPKAVGVKTNENGCPTFNGIIIHALVFMCIVRYMMNVELPFVK